MSVLKATVTTLSLSTVAVTVWPTQPGFVFCKVDVQVNGRSVGVLTGVSHYVTKAIQISMVPGPSITLHSLADEATLIASFARPVPPSFIRASAASSHTPITHYSYSDDSQRDFSYSDDSQLDDSQPDDSQLDSQPTDTSFLPSYAEPAADNHDRYGVVHVTLDQEVGDCQQEWFDVNGWEVTYVRTRPGLFETVCDVWLTSDFSGMKLLRVNQNRVASRALLTNDVTSLDVVYERNRPFVELYDVTEEAQVLKEKRVVLAAFSRAVSDLQVLKIACEGCIVLDLQRLSLRAFQFAVVANRPATSVVHVSVMEGAVADVAGVGNVRSTPLTLTLYSGPFAVTLTSPQLPVTNNSTVTCLLFATEPLREFSDALFTVKNGFVVSLDPAPHVDSHPNSPNTYHYTLVARSTVQGSMCIEAAKGASRSLD